MISLGHDRAMTNLQAPPQQNPPPSQPLPPSNNFLQETISKDKIVLPLYDVYLDLPHPGTYDYQTNKSNPSSFTSPPVILAPPPGVALENSRATADEILSKGLGGLIGFAFPEFRLDHHGAFRGLINVVFVEFL